MTDGNSTGLESTDASSAGDAPTSSADLSNEAPSAEEISSVILWLEDRAEWQAKRALEDAQARWESEVAAREGFGSR